VCVFEEKINQKSLFLNLVRSFLYGYWHLSSIRGWYEHSIIYVI